jgi:glutamyl-tRNA synthetase
MPVLKVRAKDLNELAANAVFLFAQRPLTLDAKAKRLLTPEARALLARIQDAAGENGWTSEGPRSQSQGDGRRDRVGPGKLAQPLRAALTGQTTSPGFSMF